MIAFTGSGTFFHPPYNPHIHQRFTSFPPQSATLIFKSGNFHLAPKGIQLRPQNTKIHLPSGAGCCAFTDATGRLAINDRLAPGHTVQRWRSKDGRWVSASLRLQIFRRQCCAFIYRLRIIKSHACVRENRFCFYKINWKWNVIDGGLFAVVVGLSLRAICALNIKQQVSTALQYLLTKKFLFSTQFGRNRVWKFTLPARFFIWKYIPLV